MTARLLALVILGSACVTAVGDDVESLDTIESELSASQWGPSILIRDATWGEHRTTGSPSLVFYDQQLWSLYPSATGSGLYKWATFDGGGWSAPGDVIGVRTFDGLSLTVYNNLLTAIYRVDRQYYMVTKASTRWAPWSAPVLLETTARPISRPGLVVHGGRLYLGYRDFGGDVAIDRLDGTRLQRIWTRHPEAGGADGSFEVSLASFNNRLHAYWIEKTFTRNVPIFWAWDAHNTVSELVANPGSTYVIYRDIGMTAIEAPTVSVCNGTAHLIHSGNGGTWVDEVWWATQPATGGTGWSPAVKLSKTSAFTPALACNAYVIPTLITGDGRMWYSEFQ